MVDTTGMGWDAAYCSLRCEGLIVCYCIAVMQRLIAPCDAKSLRIRGWGTQQGRDAAYCFRGGE